VHPMSGMQLFCAGFWPPNGAEDTGGPGDPDSGQTDRRELLRTADEWAACVAEPTARRADFVAEYERIRALAQDLLGAPTRTLRGVPGVDRAIWDRAGMALVLAMGPDHRSYDACDWIALSVAPAVTAADF
jgi:hypothetical protein